MYDKVYHKNNYTTGKQGWGNSNTGPSKVFEVGVYSLENRRLPKGVVASRAFATMKERSG